MLYGAAYYPEHRDPGFWEHDLDLMQKAHVNALRVGEFAWKRFEPAPGQYEFDWMDRFADLARERDIGLYLCAPLRTAPAWLMEAHPEIAIQHEHDYRVNYGTRYTFCINNPELARRGINLARAMAAHYADCPNLIGWHVDNEFGCELDCHCPACQQEWHLWLRERYGTIHALNEAWGTVFWGLEFDRFAQVPTPRTHWATNSPSQLLAWRRFRSECTVDVVRRLAEAIRREDNRPVTTNCQPLHNARTDYYEMSRPLDLTGTNYYPPYGPNGRAISLGLTACRGYKQQNFMVFELRNGPHMRPGSGGNTPAPGEVRRLSAHCVANGADGIFYFRWRACPFGPEQTHGTLTGYDGRPLPVYTECADTGARLERIAPLLEGSTVQSEIALFYDFPTRWTMDNPSHWQSTEGLCLDLSKRLHGIIRARGINCDIVGRTQDMTDYKIVVVPALGPCGDGMAARLADYVHGGGTLVWHPLSGARNEESSIYAGRLHPDLQKLFGVDATEFATLSKDDTLTFAWQDGEFDGHLFADILTPVNAEGEGTHKTGHWAGRPALTVSQRGQGRAIYISTYPEDRFYKAFFGRLLQQCRIHPILDSVPAPVEIAERTCADGSRLIFLMSYSDEPQNVALPEPMDDVWNETPAITHVELPPCGVSVLTTA